MISNTGFVGLGDCSGFLSAPAYLGWVVFYSVTHKRCGHLWGGGIHLPVGLVGAYMPNLAGNKFGMW